MKRLIMYQVRETLEALVHMSCTTGELDLSFVYLLYHQSSEYLWYLSGCSDVQIGPEIIKLVFLLNSTEQELKHAHKC